MAHMATDHDGSLLMRWRWAICRSDLPAPTRHVLHVLGFTMALDGTGCQMSTRTLAKLTGMSRSTVRTHLKPAEGTWLEVGRDASQAGDADANMYRPLVPAGVGREPDGVGLQPAHGGPGAGRGVGREPATISISNSTTTSATAFGEVWESHRKGSKKKAQEEYRKAVPTRVTHERLVGALRAYRDTLNPPKWRGHDLFRWIRDDLWEEFDATPTTGTSGNGRLW